jgi:hypothetical protein
VTGVQTCALPIYANEGGSYDDLAAYLKRRKLL